MAFLNLFSIFMDLISNNCRQFRMLYILCSQPAGMRLLCPDYRFQAKLPVCKLLSLSVDIRNSDPNFLMGPEEFPLCRLAPTQEVSPDNQTLYDPPCTFQVLILSVQGQLSVLCPGLFW